MLGIQIILASFAASLGAFLLFFPRKGIEFQIAFYRRINWIMEPVSMEKEIRNTKVMGGGTLILGILGLLYLFRQFFQV